MSVALGVELHSIHEEVQNSPAAVGSPSIDAAVDINSSSSSGDSISSECPEIDYRLWHEKPCRQFLIQCIKGLSTSFVDSLIDSPEQLRNFLSPCIEQRQVGELDKGLGFLNLSNYSPGNLPDDSSIITALKVRDMRNDDVSIISTSSQSSTNSFATQVSDSFLNDLQQSAELFLRDLQLANEDLLAIEGGGFLSKFKGIKALYLNGEAKMLQNAFRELEATLRNARSDMETIGFSDLGLQLNICENEWREMVFEFLQAAKKEAKRTGSFVKLKRMLKLSKSSEGIHDEYPRLARSTMATRRMVVQMIQRGIDVRDAFLNDSYEVMNEVAHECAKQSRGYFRDEFSGPYLLVGRYYIGPEEQKLANFLSLG